MGDFPKIITDRSFLKLDFLILSDELIQRYSNLSKFLWQISVHGMFLKGVYKTESDTKTEYEGF